jgi:hypothetical protein
MPIAIFVLSADFFEANKIESITAIIVQIFVLKCSVALFYLNLLSNFMFLFGMLNHPCDFKVVHQII